MAETVSNVPASSGASGASGTSGTSATGTGNSGGSGYTTSTTVSSLEELKKIAPEVYQKMLEGIAMNMVSQIKKQADRLKEIMREARRQAGIR